MNLTFVSLVSFVVTSTTYKDLRIALAWLCVKDSLCAVHTLRMASTAFRPPNAKEFEIAARTGIARATLGT